MKRSGGVLGYESDAKCEADNETDLGWSLVQTTLYIVMLFELLPQTDTWWKQQCPEKCG